MTNRDRIVLIVVSSLAVLAAGWLLLVSPERKQAASLKTQVDAASAQLASSSGELAKARADQARYAAAYASVVSLGKAVPAGREVPSLIYQLAQASNQKNVDFSSITAGGSTAGSPAAAASTPASATATSGSSTTAAGFTQMPFTFVFNGNFEELYHLFQQLNGYTVRTTSGGLRVSGRLLTIQSTKLTPLAATASSGTKPTDELTGTITATAYVLPASQGLTGGATAASPTGSATTPVSSATTASSPSAPAIVRVAP
jgi:Tfp pilus assembly protein PilO